MNLQIYEEASEWLVKHRNGGLDAGDKKLFDAWLRESPQHVRAYLEMSTVYEDVPALDPGWNPSVDELVVRARADVNVMPLDAPTSRAFKLTTQVPPSGPRGDSAWSRRGLLSALAASVLMIVAGSWFYLNRGVYATDTGEQRSLALADGSTVELNSRSRIKVRYNDRERRIDLLEGQALFHVAKNKDRPFIVQADNTRVRAVGTAFDVYKAASGTVVTVVEGRVSVHRERVAGTAQDPVVTVKRPPGASRAGSASAEILLDAGEQLIVTPKAAPLPKQANIASATAWTRRSLVFDASPLVEVAQEFNRYNTRQLVIEDAQLSDFHVSGVFSSVEPTLFLQFLRAQPELSVQETDTEIRISKR